MWQAFLYDEYCSCLYDEGLIPMHTLNEMVWKKKKRIYKVLEIRRRAAISFSYREFKTAGIHS